MAKILQFSQFINEQVTESPRIRFDLGSTFFKQGKYSKEDINADDLDKKLKPLIDQIQGRISDGVYVKIEASESKIPQKEGEGALATKRAETAKELVSDILKKKLNDELFKRVTFIKPKIETKGPEWNSPEALAWAKESGKDIRTWEEYTKAQSLKIIVYTSKEHEERVKKCDLCGKEPKAQGGKQGKTKGPERHNEGEFLYVDDRSGEHPITKEKYSREIYIGYGGGALDVFFDPELVPDRMIVSYGTVDEKGNWKEIDGFDTGYCTQDKGTADKYLKKFNLELGKNTKGLKTAPGVGPAKGSFIIPPNSDGFVRAYLYGPDKDTVWNYKMSCLTKPISA